jgi:hypothetical protein
MPLICCQDVDGHWLMVHGAAVSQQRFAD